MLTNVNICSIIISARTNVRPKHPNKHIEKAIQYAETKSWHYQPSGHSAHAWGRLFCPLASREGHIMSIWSTPRIAEHHAQQIIRNVDECEHGEKK